MKFKVRVENRMCTIGYVTVDCDTREQAVQMVDNEIESGALTPRDIDWGGRTYDEFGTFGVSEGAEFDEDT